MHKKANLQSVDKKQAEMKNVKVFLMAQSQAFCNALNLLISTKEIPTPLAYRLMKDRKNMVEDAKHYIELKNKIIKEYGAKKEDGNLDIHPITQMIELDKNKKEEWEPQMKALDELVTQVRGVKLSEISHLSGLSAADLEALDNFISED